MPTPASPGAGTRPVASVEALRLPAEALGRSLGDLVNDPDAFAAMFTAGLSSLADPAYLQGQRRIAPGIGPIHGVRQPLLAAVYKGFRGATLDQRPTTLLFIADRLFAETELESRWFAFHLLDRTLADETERSWQLLRRAAREADDWITVDSLAHPYGRGIGAEPYRWAELELLVYSPSRWERRLVGSTVATMAHLGPRQDRDRTVARHGLPLLANLMGDREPEVQKALSWAYRSLVQVDHEATEAALLDETDIAARTDDGHRAWVVRDTLTKLDPSSAERIRASLSSVRKRPGAPATSMAAAITERFGTPPDPSTHPEPPLT